MSAPRCPRKGCPSQRFALVDVRKVLRFRRQFAVPTQAAVRVRLRCERCRYYWWSAAPSVVAWARVERDRRRIVPRPKGSGMDAGLPVGDR